VSELQNGSPDRRSWTLSPVFLLLIAACLACAVWMLMRPEHARALVFPFVLLAFLISICLHEFGHALVAYLCGDSTVRDSGYLTLDPLRYTDVQYSILFPILFVAIGGIGLPGGAVYVNTLLLRRRIYGALVSVAGPLATALFLALVMILLKVPAVAAAPMIYAALAFLAMLEVTALIFNLVPCPGLDGWGVVEPFLPDAVRRFGRRLAPIAPVILVLALFFVPSLNNLFWDVVYTICAQIGLDLRAVRSGFAMFQFWR